MKASFYKLSPTVLAVAMWSLAAPVLAMQELDDSALSEVDAQDGLNIKTQYDQLEMESIYWEDSMGLPTNVQDKRRAYFNTVKMTGSNLGVNTNIDIATSPFDEPSIYLDVAANYGTFSADSLKICDSTGAACSPTLGGLAIQSSEAAVFKIFSVDGLLNQASNGELTLGLRNTNIYWTLRDGAVRNQLIYKDFNFNFFGKGAMWVDTDGLHLASKGAGNYIDFTKVTDNGAHPSIVNAKKPGVNIEMMYKGAVPANEYSLANAKGLLRLGASGRAVESEMVFSGTDTASLADDILGYAYDATGVTTIGANSKVLGSTGVLMKLRGEFTNADNLAGGEEFSLELAHAGNNAYGFEFSNLKPLLVRKQNGGGATNQDRAYLDMGSVYINLFRSKTLDLPQNGNLNDARLGSSFVTTLADYSHTAIPNADVDGVVIAIRDMEFQALSRRGRFIISNDVPFADAGRVGLNDATTNDWGIGLPIYNLDANFALYGKTVGTTERLGFALGLSTQGNNSDNNPLTNTDGDKTTSILLIDAAPNPLDGGQPTSYYFGLRNINMLLTADGSIGFEGGKLNLDLPNLLVAASFEVATGYLPGARYRSNNFGSGIGECTANEAACYVPIDSFTTSSDSAFGVNLRLKGAMNLDLIPGGNTLADNNIRFKGWYNMTEGAIQIVDTVDGSVLGLDNLSGRINFDNAIKINKDNVNFNYGFTVNPNYAPADVLKVKDVNLYPLGGTAQRLGEIAMTGGILNSSFTLKPFKTP